MQIVRLLKSLEHNIATVCVENWRDIITVMLFLHGVSAWIYGVLC
jgi:hypothetical protein